MGRGVGVLEAIIIVCSLVYLIIDSREHLRMVKTEVEMLEQLEKKVSLLLP